MTPLEKARRHYAEEVTLAGGVRSARVSDAFASVRREDFLGPGPWQVPLAPRTMGGEWTYRTTEDTDPERLCHNVLIAIDPERKLHNGLPSFLAFKIDAAAIEPRDRIVHVGCGVGYYTAIMAELANQGRVIAFEADPELAERSRANLQPWPHVEVVSGDATRHEPGPAEVWFVNAGVTHPPAAWLEHIAPGGRMILPLTHRGEGDGRGIVLRVERGDGPGFAARPISGVAIFDCVGGRDDACNDALGEAFARGSFESIRWLGAADHEARDSCWAHLAGSCLATEPP